MIVTLDAPMRSGNHFCASIISSYFPYIKLFWGYKRPHNPESFTLTKEKTEHILTVLRNPLDSIVSSFILFNTPLDKSALDSINDNKKMLQSMLDNVDNIHISSFEDLTKNTPKYISDISKILDIKPVDADIDNIKNKLKNYNREDFYVIPVDNQIKKDIFKGVILNNYKNEISECLDLYQSLQQYVI